MSGFSSTPWIVRYMVRANMVMETRDLNDIRVRIARLRAGGGGPASRAAAEEAADDYEHALHCEIAVRSRRVVWRKASPAPSGRPGRTYSSGEETADTRCGGGFTSSTPTLGLRLLREMPGGGPLAHNRWNSGVKPKDEASARTS